MLYCKDRLFPVSILLHKLQKSLLQAYGDNMLRLPENLSEEIYKLATGGLLIELNIFAQKNRFLRKNKTAEATTIKLYEIGEYKNMDNLFNNLDRVKPQPSFELKLQ
jgi:hypothetical protein